MGGVLDFDRERVDTQRVVAVEVVLPTPTRYNTVIALLTLGDDKQLDNAVRDLTPKVMKVAEVTPDKEPEFTPRRTSRFHSRQNAVQLTTLKVLLLGVSVKDQRVETGKKVKAVGDPPRCLDHAGKGCAIK